MCNEILGNYTKKEDHLMTAAFGTHEKRRLNRVMDALNTEYPDYDRLDEGAGGAKRKRVVSILKRQTIRSVKEDQRAVKKHKVLAESKDSAPIERKLVRMATAEMKVQDVPEKTAGPSPSSSIDVSEILKVMTEPFLVAMLSPLGSYLTSLLQSKEKGFEQSSGGKKTASATEGNVGGQKKRRMMDVMQAIQKTPPSTSAEKIVVRANAEYTTEAKANEATREAQNLGTTMSEIGRLITDVAPKKDIVEVSTDKASEDTDLDLRHLGSQELSDEDISELKEFALAGGYKTRSVLFGGADEEILGCIPDRVGAKIVNTLSKTIGFTKLEQDLSNYRRQHINGSLFYSNFKV
jgi:hypothetical protein